MARDQRLSCDDPPRPIGHLAAIMQDYVHPREVVQDVRLDPAERRALLCFWASDACAVESRPGFRWLPGTPGPILFDHVTAALRALDQTAREDRDEMPWAVSPRAPQPMHAGT